MFEEYEIIAGNPYDVVFVNPETDQYDEVQFNPEDAEDLEELFIDFCRENGWKEIPTVIYVEEGVEE